MKTINVTIKGTSPLLMNRPDLLELSDKAKERKSGEDFLEKQFIKKQYRNSDNLLYIPDTHIRGALIGAGKNIKVTGKGKSTYSKIFGYAIEVKPPEILHKKTKLDKHIVIAVNPPTKMRRPLCRPTLKEWEADFQIEYDDEEIPEEVVKLALDNAGRRVGIGDWRPAKKGTFGRFIVTSFAEAKAEHCGGVGLGSVRSGRVR